MEQKDLTIKWIDFDDKIIKFVELKDPVYDLADAVNDFAKKTGVSSGAKVTVKIDGTKGEHGTIEHLQVANGQTTPPPAESKKEEPKKETPPTPSTSGDVISEFSSNNNTLSFQGNPTVFKLDKKVSYFMQKANIGVGSKVSFQIADGLIIKIQKAKTEAPQETKASNDYDKAPATTEAKTESPSTTTQKKTYSNDVQTSIEAQASVNSSCEVVSSMINDKTDPEVVLRMIEKIADHNYKLIQKLKQN